MSLLKLQDPSQAQGKTKEIYSLFDQLGWVPKPFLLFSPSEHLLDIRAQIVKRRGAHPSLSRGFFALLRMILAENLGYTYCVSFNADLLKGMGIANDDQLGAVLADPAAAPLSDAEKGLLQFVIKAVKTPDAVNAADMEAMHAQGWTDGDILEATVQGTDMAMMDTLFRAFKMDEDQSC